MSQWWPPNPKRIEWAAARRPDSLVRTAQNDWNLDQFDDKGRISPEMRSAVRNGGRLQQPSECHSRETAEWLKARLIMAVAGLLEGSYEPLADADRLVIVEHDFAGLRFQRKLIMRNSQWLDRAVWREI